MLRSGRVVMGTWASAGVIARFIAPFETGALAVHELDRSCAFRKFPALKTHASRTIGTVAALAAGLIAGSPAVPVAAASDAMPVAQRNALVQKHCAVCHNDARLNGGLSLEHFDAADPDPTVTAMLLSKVRDAGAMGAAAIPMPGETTQDALVSALTAEAIGASAWTVNRKHNSTAQALIFTTPTRRSCCSAKGALIGAAIGAAVGFGFSRLCDASDCTSTSIKYMAILGGIGAGIGVMPAHPNRDAPSCPERIPVLRFLLTSLAGLTEACLS